MGSGLKQAAFAAGCFWGAEETFRCVPGVIKTEVGYMGGFKENPTYEDVCEGDTGHAETVRLEYDSEKISYKELLNVFWENHDPTTLNRQGPDIGEQYRSVIFFYDSKQEELARDSLKDFEKSGKYANPIVTQIVSATEFYRAEEYHQKYLQKRGENSCRI